MILSFQIKQRSAALFFLCFLGNQRILVLTFENLSTHATNTITLRKKSLATSTPSCTRQTTGPATPSSCTSTFRACPFRNQRTILKHCRALAGRWCKRICCASCRDED